MATVGRSIPTFSSCLCSGVQGPLRCSGFVLVKTEVKNSAERENGEEDDWQMLISNECIHYSCMKGQEERERERERVIPGCEEPAVTE